MAARIALVLSAAVLCLVLGLVSAPAVPAVVAPTHPLRLAELRLDPSGVEAAAAASALAGASPPAPVRASDTRVAPSRVFTAPPARPPPPPGADAVLRSSVAAITESGGRLNLVLAGGGRRLGEGDVFLGWTVASVSRTGAVLRKGGARRDVSFFAPDPSAARSVGASSSPVLAATPQPLPGRRPVAPMPAAPTAAEFFRGFKG